MCCLFLARRLLSLRLFAPAAAADAGLSPPSACCRGPVVFGVRDVVGGAVVGVEQLQLSHHLQDLCLVGVAEIQNGIANHVPHLFEMPDREVIICQRPEVRTTKRGLEGESIRDRQLSVGHDARGRLLALLDLETTIVEAEAIRTSAQQARENLLLAAGALTVAVHEHILLTAVPVNVDVQDDIPVVHEMSHHALGEKYGGVHLATGVVPQSIQILPGQ
mmetsp:Transcript_64911/g.186523  ORF Transcript_64911/g.186523 Transcript_64911/m.186523 type:complete len:219 (-) Transcript_64911:888-1544(-)